MRFCILSLKCGFNTALGYLKYFSMVSLTSLPDMSVAIDHMYLSNIIWLVSKLSMNCPYCSVLMVVQI